MANIRYSVLSFRWGRRWCSPTLGCTLAGRWCVWNVDLADVFLPR